VVGNQVAFKGSNGKYLARCSKCWKNSAYPDSAFIYVDSGVSTPAKLFTPVLQSNGKYSFKADNGKYLTRCRACITNKQDDFVFIHESDSSKPYAQWDVIYTDLPLLGTYKIKANTGNFSKFCPSCRPT
jgi:hypothetical protein